MPLSDEKKFEQYPELMKNYITTQEILNSLG